MMAVLGVMLMLGAGGYALLKIADVIDWLDTH